MHTCTQKACGCSPWTAIGGIFSERLGVCRATDPPEGPCSIPFGVGFNSTTTCWPPIVALDYWPTTLPCADFMSTVHSIDSSYMQQARTSCTAACLNHLLHHLL